MVYVGLELTIYMYSYESDEDAELKLNKRIDSVLKMRNEKAKKLKRRRKQIMLHKLKPQTPVPTWYDPNKPGNPDLEFIHFV